MTDSGIVDKSPGACVDRFRAHLAKLFDALLQPKHNFGRIGDPSACVLGFVQGLDVVAVPLRGGDRACSLWVSFGVKAVAFGKKYRLETEAYQYKILATNKVRRSEPDAVLRWEYRRVPKEADFRSPRHHVQARATATMGGSGLDLDLNRAHTPTGWVTIEEVLRFLFEDLGVPCKLGRDAWNDVLNESERKFYESYTSRRFHPHP